MRLWISGARCLKWCTDHIPWARSWTSQPCHLCGPWYARGVAACDAFVMREGSTSHGLVRGATVGRWYPQERSPARLGRTFTTIKRRWIFCWWRCMPHNGSFGTFAQSSGTKSWPESVRSLAARDYPRCAINGAVGRWVRSYGGTPEPWRYHGTLLRSDPLWPELTGRCMAGYLWWLRDQRNACQSRVWPVAHSHATPVLIASVGCASTATSTSPATCAAWSSTRWAPQGSRCPLFILAILVVASCATSWSWRDQHRRWLNPSRRSRRRPWVMCGGDANPAALPLAGWQAVDAIQQVEDQRIQAWREDNGLTLDEDFAFAFTTYEQAQVMAGGLAADRWVAVRSAASDSMLQEVSAAIHDMRAAPAQPLRRPAPKFKARRPGVRLRPNAEDSPEVVTKRVDALAAIWVTLWRQSRALAALKWIVKNGDLCWPLHHASIPTTVSRKRLRSQAPVVAPPMLGHLEDTIVGCCGINDPEWLCLMGSWMVAVGVLRHRHLERSTPRKVTLGFLHAHCSKGKQRRLRSGFDFAIPASFSNSWPWLDHWLRWWKQLDEDLQKRVGLCFHPEGRAFTLSEVQDATQRCFARQVDNEEQLTSYSWRRLLPTVGHTLQMDSIALSSLGDWQERSKQDKDATMALHYSSAKYGASLQSKATALGAMAVLQAFDTWEQITPSAASDAVEAGRRRLQSPETITWSGVSR